MLDKLQTEQINPVSESIDRCSTEEILRTINTEDSRIAATVGAEIPRIRQAVDMIVERIRHGGRLFYIGAGTSGRLGVLDAAECPPTFQVPPELVQGIIAGGEAALTRSTEASEDDPEAGARDLAGRGFTRLDVLAGITTSGRTPYVLGAIEAAREMGALTIGISSNPGSEISRKANLAITPLTGAEVIAGSTRMKAGTATKLVLNMISTAVMIRLGHVYGNLMVNVRPVNSKLADRARRIVRLAAKVEPDEASRLLEAAGGNVKIAIIMTRSGTSRQEAERKLAAAGGQISEALEE